jgi:hypothetical protein
MNIKPKHVATMSVITCSVNNRVWNSLQSVCVRKRQGLTLRSFASHIALCARLLWGVLSALGFAGVGICGARTLPACGCLQKDVSSLRNSLLLSLSNEGFQLRRLYSNELGVIVKLMPYLCHVTPCKWYICTDASEKLGVFVFHGGNHKFGNYYCEL